MTGTHLNTTNLTKCKYGMNSSASKHWNINFLTIKTFQPMSSSCTKNLEPLKMLSDIYTYHCRCPFLFLLDSEQIWDRNILSVKVPWIGDTQTSTSIKHKKGKKWHNQCLTTQNILNVFWFKISMSQELGSTLSLPTQGKLCDLGQASYLNLIKS